MAYVTVPKDLTAVKTKVLLNLTKRHLICFGSGALVGVPVSFLLKGVMNVSAAAQSVVASASGVIVSDASIDLASMLPNLEDRLMEMEKERFSFSV